MGYGTGIASLSPAIVSLWQESGGHDLHLRDVSTLFGTEAIVMIHRATGHELSHIRAFREMVVESFKGVFTNVSVGLGLEAER